MTEGQYPGAESTMGGRRAGAIPGAAAPGSEFEAAADQVGPEGVGECGGEGVLGFPAGAVGRDQHARILADQGRDGLRDDLLEDPASEVEPA